MLSPIQILTLSSIFSRPHRMCGLGGCSTSKVSEMGADLRLPDSKAFTMKRGNQLRYMEAIF